MCGTPENISEESYTTFNGVGSPLEPRPKASPSYPVELNVLATWPASGKISQHKDALKRLQNCFCPPGDLIITQHIVQFSLSGVAGVLEGTFSPFRKQP